MLVNDKLYLSDENKTLSLGYSLARTKVDNLIIFLEGDLGCGKTTFVKGFLRGLGYLGKVKSPTYNILEEYNVLGIDIYHFDLYRFQSSQEWIDGGFYEIADKNGLIFIEWPNMALDYLPEVDLIIKFSVINYARECAIFPITLSGNNIYKKWKILLEEI